MRRRAAAPRSGIARARRVLEEDGLLLEADAVLPSVTTIVAGGAVRGSWWGHPAGRAIYRAFHDLADAPGVSLARLVNGKVTLVHPRLRRALLAVGRSGEAWQTRGLSAAARRLLARVRAAGSVRATGDAVRELEARLLVRAAQVHTETGAHEKVVTSWERAAEEAGVAERLPAPAAARAAFEAVARAWERETGWVARLPWEAGRAARGRRGGRASSTGG